MDYKTIVIQLKEEDYRKLKDRATDNKRAVSREAQHILEESLKKAEAVQK